MRLVRISGQVRLAGLATWKPMMTVRPGWALGAEWALGAALAGAAIFGLPRVRRRALWLTVVIAGVMATSMVAFTWGALLLDPLRPLVLGGVTALAVLAALFAETTRTARQLREARLAPIVDFKGRRAKSGQGYSAVEGVLGSADAHTPD